jgi:hypothetical protein
MPRKKSEKGKPVNAAGEELKAVRVELSTDVHRLLRRVAAEVDKSMASYAREFLEAHVRSEAKKKGIK